jgi:hypothetical protein
MSLDPASAGQEGRVTSTPARPLPRSPHARGRAAVALPDDPWRRPVPHYYAIPHTTVIDAESRLEEIKRSTDITWLRKVLAWPDNQVSVRAAAERRLRKLQRERILS